MTIKKQKLVDGGDYFYQQFFGLQTAVKNPKELAPGQPQDSLNFLTGYNVKTKTADNIQLRTGSTLLGKTRLGAGKVSALAVGLDASGNPWPFFIAGGQAYYFNSSTGDISQVSNGSGLVIEDMTMEYYQDLFGPYVYLGSPNNQISVISVASKQMSSGLGTVQAASGGPFTGVSGYFTIRQNFAWMWNYINQATKLSYPNNLNQSNPDQVAPSNSGISNPQGSTGVSGNGVLQTFSGTLSGFSPLGFTVQVGAPSNSLAVTSVAISGIDITINYTGGDLFTTGQYVALQQLNGLVQEKIGNAIIFDFIGIVVGHGNGSVIMTLILSPTTHDTTNSVATFAVNTAGSGYVIGDIVAIADPTTPIQNAVFLVTAVNVSGGLTTAGLKMLNGGIGFGQTGNPDTVLSGSGSNAKITPISNSGNQIINDNVTVSLLELFEDDSNGNLKSTLGSAGTINYITGAFTINTQVPVPNALNIDSINFQGIPGILQFAYGTWQQFGGPLRAVKFFSGQLYEFHAINTWVLSLTVTNATVTTGQGTQQQYRQNMGVPYFRSAFETADGILFLDNTIANTPRLKNLAIVDLNTEPEELSDEMDFSVNNISTAVVSRAGTMDFLACQSINNGVAKGFNDTCYIRNNISGFYDKTDFRIAAMDIYNGGVIAGDSISQNVLQLFTGVDDDGAPINAHWTSGQDNWGFSGLKSFNYFHIDGFIGISQVFNIYAQYDTGNYVLIGSIYGNGSYIDMNNSILIGQGLGGENPLGGAGNGQIYGYHFEVDLPVFSPLFEYISIMFVPGLNLQTMKPAFGALQINLPWGFRDIRLKAMQGYSQLIGN